MRKLSIVLIFATLGLVAFQKDSGGQKVELLPNTKMVHIGIVVKNLEASLDDWMLMLGQEKRPSIIMAKGHHDNPTHYRGKPSDAKARLAILTLENIQVELIEPIGNEPSHWREFLDAKGDGVHHMAFQIEDLEDRHLENFEKNGFPMVQKGGWDDGKYVYMDGMESLGVMVELLEIYDK